MKTEQEQIEEMRRTIYNTRSKVNGIATAGDIAEALVQAGYGDVKQAKIDILNCLKEKCKFDGHTVAVYKNDIDELIKEVENGK